VQLANIGEIAGLIPVLVFSAEKLVNREPVPRAIRVPSDAGNCYSIDMQSPLDGRIKTVKGENV
jgi:hypothetical protein